MFSPCAALLACSVQPEFSKTKPNFPKSEALSFCFQGREDLLLFTRKSLLLGSFKTKMTNIQIVQQTNALFNVCALTCLRDFGLSKKKKASNYLLVQMFHLHAQSKPELSRAETQVQLLFSLRVEGRLKRKTMIS